MSFLFQKGVRLAFSGPPGYSSGSLRLLGDGPVGVQQKVELVVHHFEEQQARRESASAISPPVSSAAELQLIFRGLFVSLALHSIFPCYAVDRPVLSTGEGQTYVRCPPLEHVM